jgi:threonine synthase
MNYAPPVHVTGLKCEICGTFYNHSNLYTCPACGDEGILDVEYDYESIASSFSKHPLQIREQNIWRYNELLPVSAGIARPHLFVGWTPVYDIPRMAKAFGIRQFFLKDDGRNPTNSFKDRASSVGVLKSIEFGFSQIACASTGNAASSLAGLSAATGLKSYIFVPERAPEPKVTQLLIFGATVMNRHLNFAKLPVKNMDGTTETVAAILFLLKAKKLQDLK